LDRAVAMIREASGEARMQAMRTPSERRVAYGVALAYDASLGADVVAVVRWRQGDGAATHLQRQVGTQRWVLPAAINIWIADAPLREKSGGELAWYYRCGDGATTGIVNGALADQAVTVGMLAPYQGVDRNKIFGSLFLPPDNPLTLDPAPWPSDANGAPRLDDQGAAIPGLSLRSKDGEFRRAVRILATGMFLDTAP
jgi:hypothetical protein